MILYFSISNRIEEEVAVITFAKSGFFFWIQKYTMNPRRIRKVEKSSLPGRRWQ